MRRNKKWSVSMAVLMISFSITKMVSKIMDESENIDDNNPYLETSFLSQIGTMESSDTVNKNFIYDEERGEHTIYEKSIKPFLDIVLAFSSLILLSPIFLIISVAIVIDDPGPILFSQKRVGKDKHFFLLHKFRSMRVDCPHDTPTHQLTNPDIYITRVGRILRKTSLDELPQIWDIFRGKMSIIGPRPALWNQEDLVVERERYRANSVLPGLTGLAQISGRDKLEIYKKAKIDGDYVFALKTGSFKGFFTDVRCLLKTIISVLKSDGVVEGDTRERKNKEWKTN